MIRNLKVLIAAAMALAAFGAFSASGAQAAEFHCSTAPCTITLKPDGTLGKEKHHVFIISNGEKSASSTCGEMTGTATSETATTKELTLTGVKYHTCTLAGSAAEVKMNSCDYLFTNTGEVHVKCTTAGDGIEIIAGACKVKVGPQTIGTVSYTSINAKKEVTVSTKVINVASTASGCAGLGLPDGAYNKSEYSTGNTIAHSTGNSVWYE